MVLTPSLSLMSPCGPRFPRGLPRARAPVFSGVIAYGAISGLSASGSSWRQFIPSAKTHTKPEKFFDFSAPSVGTAGPAVRSPQTEKAAVRWASGPYRARSFVKSKIFWELVSFVAEVTRPRTILCHLLSSVACLSLAGLSVDRSARRERLGQSRAAEVFQSGGKSSSNLVKATARRRGPSSKVWSPACTTSKRTSCRSPMACCIEGVIRGATVRLISKP